MVCCIKYKKLFKFQEVVTEKELISFQGNLELVDENKTQAYHWFNLESFWIAPQSCLHPLHENQETDQRKCKKVKDLRQSNIAASKRIKG